MWPSRMSIQMEFDWLEKILFLVSFCKNSQKEFPESMLSVEGQHESHIYLLSSSHLSYIHHMYVSIYTYTYLCIFILGVMISVVDA